jgi:hypothetical protein
MKHFDEPHISGAAHPKEDGLVAMASPTLPTGHKQIIT